MRKPSLVRTTVFVFAFLLLHQGISGAGQNPEEGGLPPGSDAPRFQGTDVAGRPVDLAVIESTNPAVVINFWGLRCADCLLEIPHLNAIFEKWKGKGLTVLGINVDGVPADVITSHLRLLGMKVDYPLVPDEGFKIMDLYRMSAAPLTYLVGGNGKVVYRHEGYKAGDEKELERQIERLLR